MMPKIATFRLVQHVIGPVPTSIPMIVKLGPSDPRSPGWAPAMNPAAAAIHPSPRSQLASFERDGRLFGIRFGFQ
jgi:hypothetical protein